MADLAPDHGDDWRELAVSVLHVAVLEQAAPGRDRRLGRVQVRASVERSRGRDRGRRCDLAALVPPATMDHVEQIAGNREKMPPKSTYFYPKLLTGLVFNSLKAN